MISSTFGAPFGGTTRGAHQGVDSVAFSLITPLNFGSGDGSCLPSIEVVALGEPRTPVTCCALPQDEFYASAKAETETAIATMNRIAFMRRPSFRRP